MMGGGFMRLSIDYEKCQGHGRCYSVAPELFEADEAGFGVVRTAQLDRPDEPAARQAIDACPERAIVLSDDDRKNRQLEMG
jgi:ferredoxin